MAREEEFKRGEPGCMKRWVSRFPLHAERMERVRAALPGARGWIEQWPTLLWFYLNAFPDCDPEREGFERHARRLGAGALDVAEFLELTAVEGGLELMERIPRSQLSGALAEWMESVLSNTAVAEALRALEGPIAAATMRLLAEINGPLQPALLRAFNDEAMADAELGRSGADRAERPDSVVGRVGRAIQLMQMLDSPLAGLRELRSLQELDAVLEKLESENRRGFWDRIPNGPVRRPALDFPVPPPLPGTRAIEALDTDSALRKAAHALGIEPAPLAAAVLDRLAYVYLVKLGVERAWVVLIRTESDAWCLRELRGHSDQAVSSNLKSLVKNWLTANRTLL